MKKLLVLTVLVCCVAFAGCSKDGEISSFITEFETVTTDITKKLEEGDIDGAKKTFDDKKSSLQTSWDAIKGARGFQVSEESKTKLTESVTKNVTALGIAAGKAKIKSVNDKAKSQKVDDLLNEYKKIFEM